MLETLSSPAALWCIAGLSLLAVEAFAPSFIFMFFGISALLTSITTAIGLTSNIGSQVVVFALASIITIVVLRRYAKEFFVGTSQSGKDSIDDEFVGKIVKVSVTIAGPESSGRVELKGADWTAHADSVITAGSNARIIARDGITLTVAPTH